RWPWSLRMYRWGGGGQGEGAQTLTADTVVNTPMVAARQSPVLTQPDDAVQRRVAGAVPGTDPSARRAE
ncbi:MAG: hypothetical protein AB1505_31200, partial [Candidatus Latescibacterota bacterium]